MAKYRRRRPTQVEAFAVTAETLSNVEAWIKQHGLHCTRDTSAAELHAQLHYGSNSLIKVGDVVVHYPETRDFAVLSEEEFTDAFEAAESQAPAPVAPVAPAPEPAAPVSSVPAMSDATGDPS